MKNQLSVKRKTGFLWIFIPQIEYHKRSGASRKAHQMRNSPGFLHSPDRRPIIMQPRFKETDTDTIATIIERYKEQDTWKEDTIFQKDSFELLENILEESGELKERVPYETLVTTVYSEKAAK